MSLAHATRDNPTAAAHRIGSDDEALETARELAALFARESIQRDRERRLPLEELELFSRSGLGHRGAPRIRRGRRLAGDPGEGGGDRQRRRQFPGADSAEPFLRPRSAAGERLAGAERSPVRRRPGRRAFRQRPGRDRHAYRQRAPYPPARRRRRLPPGRAQVLLHRRTLRAAGADPGGGRRGPPATGLRPARQRRAGNRRRLVRLRSTHHRQRFGAVRPGSGGRRGRGLVPGRLRAPDHRRPAGADPPRGDRRRDRPRRLRGHPAFRPRARPALGRLRRRQGQRRPTDHPRDRPPGDPPARRRSAAGACRAGARPGHRRAGRGKRGGRLDRRRRSPRADHRGRPAGRQQADRAWRQPRLSRRTRSRPPLAQRPRTHPARPGALEVPRGRRLLLNGRLPPRRGTL